MDNNFINPILCDNGNILSNDDAEQKIFANMAYSSKVIKNVAKDLVLELERDKFPYYSPNSRAWKIIELGVGKCICLSSSGEIEYFEGAIPTKSINPIIELCKYLSIIEKEDITEDNIKKKMLASIKNNQNLFFA
jgi:hypothetical protein